MPPPTPTRKQTFDPDRDTVDWSRARQRPASKRQNRVAAFVAFALGGVVVLIIVIVAAVSSSSDDKATKAKAPAATETPTPTAPATTAAPAPLTLPPPAVYDGSGDDVIEITKPTNGPAIVHARYTGGSNFVVEALDANNEQTSLLVNEIGAYEGTVALDFEDTISSRLQITASGPWHIEVQDPRTAQRFDAAFQGRGDNVLMYTGKTGIAAINHSGQSNFVVTEVTRTGSDLLVNEIGQYTGRVPWAAGDAFVVVQADGDWSITVT
jgi:hypothetical protein